MSSGPDESIYWILTIATTLSYHYFEIAVTITHNQLTLSRYKTALSEVSRLNDWIQRKKVKVIVKVTLQLAAYRQSVRLSVKALETHDQTFFFQLNSYGNSPYVRSSYEYAYEYVHFTHIACYWKSFLLRYTQVLCQYRLYRADYAYLTYRMLQWYLSHLNGRRLDHWIQSRSQSQSYFTTGSLPPISSSRRQAPWDPRPNFFFSTELLHILSDEKMGLSLRSIPGLSSSVPFTHIACYWKCLPFALYTSPLSV
jgi:hypothetical protein